jgi:hypothetical protein
VGRPLTSSARTPAGTLSARNSAGDAQAGIIGRLDALAAELEDAAETEADSPL